MRNHDATNSSFIAGSGSPGLRGGSRVSPFNPGHPLPATTELRLRIPTRAQRRGAVFIIALAVTVILSALLLVYAQEMRTEMLTSANRVAAVKADAVEQGAEQWVLAQIEANTTPLSTGTSSSGTSSKGNSSSSTSNLPTNAVNITTIPAEAIQVGDGYFWLLRPDPTQDQTYGFGITDESAKLNLNIATGTQLALLPNMTQDVADSLVNWIASSTGNASAVPSDAATNSDYLSLPEPYQIKGTANAANGTTTQYETVEEALLVSNCTAQMLYGYDLNHDGVLDQNEILQASGATATDSTTNDRRGFFNYVTVYSTSATPTAVGAAATPTRPGAPRTVGLINVNSASAKVLQCLPGLTSTDVQSIVSAQANQSTPGSTSWLSNTISTQKAQAIQGYITGTSYQYSADIVAVSGDGKSFKRVRIVVDCRTQPAIIVYRKDLTSLGWPMPPAVLTSMRGGKGIPAAVTGTTNAESGNGLN